MVLKLNIILTHCGLVVLDLDDVSILWSEVETSIGVLEWGLEGGVALEDQLNVNVLLLHVSQVVNGSFKNLNIPKSVKIPNQLLWFQISN